MTDTRADDLARDIASAVDAELAAAAEQNLRLFVRAAWKTVEPHTPFIPGWHLDAICDHLAAISAGTIRNLLINVPPRHMKSLAVGVFWPAWEWIAAPQRRWLFAAYGLSLSERDSLKCRRLIESPWYQSLWGDRFMLRIDQNTKLRYETDHAGHRIATSVGGAATGEGGDRVVVDDPHNVIERQSEAARLEALTWWDETMSTRLNDPKTAAKVIVMQRIHEKDLSGHVLEQGGYVHLCLPAEFELSRRCITVLDWRDPRTNEGELLWPARLGEKEIADFKLRLGPEGYAGQFQQRPAPAGGGRFKADWFRYWRMMGGVAETEDPVPPSSYVLLHPDGSEHLVRPRDCQRIAVMDPAGTEPGERNHPCFTVIQVWDVTPTGDMLLVHQYRRQVQAPDAAAAAVRVCQRFDVAYIAIEKDGLGLGVVQTVRREGIAVRAIKAKGPKDARTQTAEIRMAAGQIYFRQGAPYLFDLEQELLQFPNSEYADQADALAHAAMLVARIGGRSDEMAVGADPMESGSDNAGWEDLRE
ncbi:MAG TPA: phage terminase large subunit [Tepidisphaeraceae bacterium]|nr:phage terminase large subunit [Tepidisphaeraceae bacterium]